MANMARSSPDGLLAPRRYWALAGLWLAMAMSVLDSAIANIALPAIAGEFGSNPATATWVVTAYQAAIIMALLPLSALGERLGYKQVYLGGLILFIAMSFACAMASSLLELAVFRFLQGLGAAAMMGLNGALMRFVWPADLLGRGLGYNALVIAVTAAATPALAALILSLGNWHWLFLVNVPAGILSLALGLGFVPRPAPPARNFDGPSALLNAVAFGGLFLAFSGYGREVPAVIRVLVLAAGLGAGAGLLRRAAQRPRPMMPLDLIRIEALRLAYGASICAFAAQMCLLITFPFLLVARMGMNAASIGLLILPLPLGVALASPVAGRLSAARLARRFSAGGLVLLAFCLALLSALFSHSASSSLIMLAMGACGTGFGLFQTPNNHVMLRSGPLNRAGAAAGILTLSRLLGQTAGALLAAASLRLYGPTSTNALSLASLAALGGALLCLRGRVGETNSGPI